MAKNPLIRSYKKRVNTPQPNKSAGILDDFAVRKVVATKEGSITRTPTDDIDIANKKYVDDTHVPAGSEGEIQFNEGSSFQADSDLFWDNVTKILKIPEMEISTINKELNQDITFFDDPDFTGNRKLILKGKRTADSGFMRRVEMGINSDGMVSMGGNYAFGMLLRADGSGIFVPTGKCKIGNRSDGVIEFGGDSSDSTCEASFNNLVFGWTRTGTGTTQKIKFQGENDTSVHPYFEVSGLVGSRVAIFNSEITEFQGDVGIGTTSPGRRLEVADGNAQLEINSSSGTADLLVNASSGRDPRIILQENDANKWFIFNDADDADTFKIGTPTSRFSIDANGQVGIGIDIDPTIMLDVNAKSGNTPIGGFAIKLTNKTGANSVAGNLVQADSANNDAVSLAPAGNVDTMGVFLESGVSDGSEAWIVISGIADVALDDNVAAVRGNWMGAGVLAGYAATSASPPAAPTHFEEIGHCIETVAAGGAGTHILARCVLHFN